MKKSKQDLIRKAKKVWKETWTEGMIWYDDYNNEYVVGFDTYKAFFDANTLECIGEKDY